MGNDSLINLGARIGLYASPEMPQATLGGLKNNAALLLQQGGRTQQERMIKDKRKSLTKALLYSYQSAFIKKTCCGDCCPPVRGLINANRLTQDYDEKILSVGFEHGFQAGDIFEWVNTGSYWLIYLQSLTELAYFRGNIRRCDYILSWLDEDNIVHKTYAAVRGPVETKIDSANIHTTIIDSPNYSLNILMPNTDETKAYFERYSKFYLQDVCWRVEAVNNVSMPGIIEISAVEYYSNEQEDDTEMGIVGGKIEPIENPNDKSINKIIKGESFIKPKKWYEYTYCGTDEGTWIYNKDLPIDAEIVGNTIKVKWTYSYSGQFDLSFGDYTKTIVVESLF